MARRFSCLIISLILICSLMSGSCVAKEKIVLEWSTWQLTQIPHKELMEDLIRNFQKENPNVEIQLTNTGWSQYFDKLQIRLASGTGPDIFTCADDNVKLYATSGFAEPLDSYIDLSKYEFCQAAERCNIDGKTYGVVWSSLPFTLIYNKALFKEAGIENPPTTPEEMIEVAKKLTKGKEQFGYAGATDSSNPADFYTEFLVWTIGSGGRVARNGVPTVNEPQNVEAITLLKKAYDAGIMPKGIDRQLYRKMFLSGNIAMLVDGAYLFDSARQVSDEAAERLDTAPIFFPSNHVRSYSMYLCVSKDSKHKDVASKFLEFILRPEYQEQFVPCVKENPALANIEVEGTDWIKDNPWYHGYLQVDPQDSVPEGLEPYTEEIKKLVARYVGEVFLSDRPAKEALDQCQDAVVQMLQQRGYKIPW